MNYVYWLLGYKETPSVITKTAFRNKAIMNSIVCELHTFDKTVLKKKVLSPKANDNCNHALLMTDVRQFNQLRLKSILESPEMSTSSSQTIEYNFNFSSESDCESNSF